MNIYIYIYIYMHTHTHTHHLPPSLSHRGGVGLHAAGPLGSRLCRPRHHLIEFGIRWFVLGVGSVFGVWCSGSRGSGYCSVFGVSGLEVQGTVRCSVLGGLEVQGTVWCSVFGVRGLEVQGTGFAVWGVGSGV